MHLRQLRALVLALTLALAAFVPSAAAAPAQQQTGGTLWVATLGGLPKLLHPYVEPQGYTSPYTNEAMLVWGPGLISIDYNMLDYVAGPNNMAVGLPDISEDGRTFTFTLRPDIRWSDGTPITTSDFMFAWENASRKENNWVGFTSTIERIESFSTPDERTIVVTLKDRLARFLALGIAAGIGPVPRHVWEGRSWNDPVANPEIIFPTVVSGPYVPREISAERHVFNRNFNWWGRQPNLDEFTFISASPATTLELLKTRQVGQAENFPPAQYVEAQRIPTAYVVDWSGATGTYRNIEFNINRPPFNDKRFREALVRSVQRADAIQFEDDLAVEQYGLYTQNSKWKNDLVDRYEYDPQRSRQLLQEAGFRLEGGVLKDGNGRNVVLEVTYPTTSAPRGKIAAYLQQQWRQLGIEVRVTGLEFNAYVDKVSNKKEFDVSLGTWGSTLDPDSARSLFTTGGSQNFTGYSNPRVDELFRIGATEQDEFQRKSYYDEIQQLIAADLPTFSLTTLKNFTAFDVTVQGVAPASGAGSNLITQNNLQFLDWYMQQ